MNNPFSAIIGHTNACLFFKEQLARDSLAQAYMLIGPRGVGKMTLAQAVRNACGIHDTETRVISPEAGKAIISIEKVRSIVPSTRIKSTKQYSQAIIIDGVEMMTPEAANSILKILEEPPHGLIFFLISHGEGFVLPTLRSRCQQVRLYPVSDTILRTYIAQQKNTDADISEIITYADARPGLVIELLAHAKKLEQKKQLHTALQALLSKPNAESLEAIQAVFDTKKTYPERKQALVEQYALLHRIIHDILQQSSNTADYLKLSSIYKATMRHLRQLAYNPDPKIQLMETLSRLHH